jgi:DNA-3-methyladenine glycosylase I
MQSGLSWALILRKREGLREAFAGFDPKAVVGLDVSNSCRTSA